MPLRWLSRVLEGGVAKAPATLPAPLPIEQITPLLRSHLGLPHLDWEQAAIRIEPATTRQTNLDDLACATIAAWLDALALAWQPRQAIDLERWRSPGVEGLAPSVDRKRLDRATSTALAIIGRALAPIRGEPNENPIDRIAIIAAPTRDAYYDFIDAYYRDEGAFATSGGVYLGASVLNPPTLVLNVDRTALEHTVAHELTHHALAPTERDAGRLPLWAEEGLTQMMEERVTNSTHFAFDREKLRRHQGLWSSIGLDGFLHGDTFQSPHDDQQELSYNLAEAITRSLLESRPTDFFAFARACRAGQEPDGACMAHLGASQEHLLSALLRL